MPALLILPLIKSFKLKYYVLKKGNNIMKKKKFLKDYTQIPDNKNIRRFIRVIFLLINYFNIAIFINYNHFISTSLTTFLTVIILTFDLFSIVLYIFPEQMNKLIYLYTAIAFSGSSIFYLFISSLIFQQELDKSVAFLIIGLSLLTYTIIIAAVIFNIRNKIKSTYTKRYINKLLAGIIAAPCISMGIIIAKQTDIGDLPFAIGLLLMAYLLTPAISGFHRFYLIVRNKEK